MKGRVTKIDETCFLAIEDIQKTIQKTVSKNSNMNIHISITEASRILGERYFELKNKKKPILLQDFP